MKAAFLRTIRRPTSLIWVFCHILTLILGFAVLSEASKKLFGSGLAEGIGGSLDATGAAGIVISIRCFQRRSPRKDERLIEGRP